MCLEITVQWEVTLGPKSAAATGAVFSGPVVSLWPYRLYSPPGSSVHGILQVRILEWVAIPSSRGSSWPRNGIWVSCISYIGRQVLNHYAPWKALCWWLVATHPGFTFLPLFTLGRFCPFCLKDSVSLSLHTINLSSLKHSLYIRWVTGLAMFFHLWTQWCPCKQSLFRGTWLQERPWDMVFRPYHRVTRCFPRWWSRQKGAGLPVCLGCFSWRVT